MVVIEFATHRSGKNGMSRDPCVLESPPVDQAWGKENCVIVSVGRPDSLSTILRCWLTFCQQDVTCSHRGGGNANQIGP